MKKYGKPYGDIAAIKANFVEDNEKLYYENKIIDDKYKNGCKREICKICSSKLKWEGEVFLYNGISYNICENCGHLNGEYYESIEFFHNVYDETDDSHAMLYYDTSSKANYDDRVAKIYMPKLKFLENALERQEENWRCFNYLDLGAGAGYFVKALKAEGLSSYGIDVDKKEVDFGKSMIGTENMECIKEADVPGYLKNCNCQVVSMIGVLEHVLNPIEIMSSVSQNNNVKYIYFSVPTVSFSVIFGAVNPMMFNRVLGGWHTHIFSDESIKYMLDNYCFENVDEWRFGCDAADLKRFTEMELLKQGNTYLAKLFGEKYSPILDEIQLIFDKCNFSSETHVIAKKRQKDN